MSMSGGPLCRTAGGARYSPRARPRSWSCGRSPRCRSCDGVRWSCLLSFPFRCKLPLAQKRFDAGDGAAHDLKPGVVRELAHGELEAQLHILVARFVELGAQFSSREGAQFFNVHAASSMRPVSRRATGLVRNASLKAARSKAS